MHLSAAQFSRPNLQRTLSSLLYHSLGARFSPPKVIFGEDRHDFIYLLWRSLQVASWRWVCREWRKETQFLCRIGLLLGPGLLSRRTQLSRLPDEGRGKKPRRSLYKIFVLCRWPLDVLCSVQERCRTQVSLCLSTWSHTTRRSLAKNRTCTFLTGESRFFSTSQVILSIGAVPYPMELPPT